MDMSEYHQQVNSHLYFKCKWTCNNIIFQLLAINQMLKQCVDGTEKEELISLKHNIEELLSLTNDDEGTKEQEGRQVEDEYSLFMVYHESKVA